MQEYGYWVGGGLLPVLCACIRMVARINTQLVAGVKTELLSQGAAVDA